MTKKIAIWQDPDGLSWRVSTTWATVDGRESCTGVSLSSPSENPQRLTAQTLRRFPLGEFIASGSVQGPTKLPNKSSGRGRPLLHGHDHYVAVAKVYSDAWAAGQWPTDAVSKAFNVASSTAGKWIGKARADGLLPPTTRGKPRGAAGNEGTK